MTEEDMRYTQIIIDFFSNDEVPSYKKQAAWKVLTSPNNNLQGIIKSNINNTGKQQIEELTTLLIKHSPDEESKETCKKMFKQYRTEKPIKRQTVFTKFFNRLRRIPTHA